MSTSVFENLLTRWEGINNTSSGDTPREGKEEVPTLDLTITKPDDGETEDSDAGTLGLVATWSRHFGYISIHDPTLGDWWDVPFREAPQWSKNEAFKRKQLYKDGNPQAYWLTAREMERIWERDHHQEQAGILEWHPDDEEAV